MGNVSSKEQVARLREQLMKLSWPQKYMFKFVLPNDSSKVDAVVEVLPKDGLTTFKNSSGGKYVSVSCVATMASADDVLDVTERAAAIDGVISL